MLGRDLLELAGNVLELVQLGIGVIAGRGGGLGLGIEGVRLRHILLVLPDGRVDHRVRPDALGVLAGWRTVSFPLPVALLLVVLLQLLLVAQPRVLLEDVRPGLALVHGAVLRLGVAAIAGRGGAGRKALPLDALVVQRLPVEGEHGPGSSGLPQAAFAGGARRARGVLPLLLGGRGELMLGLRHVLGLTLLLLLPGTAAKEVGILHRGRRRADLGYGPRGGCGRGPTLLPLRTRPATVRRRHAGRDVIGIPFPRPQLLAAIAQAVAAALVVLLVALAGGHGATATATATSTSGSNSSSSNSSW